MKVSILGAGAFGEALGKILSYNGHETKYYDPIKFPNISLDEAISDTEIIIYAAPSDQHQNILPQLPKNIHLICASKGFLSLKPFSDFSSFSALGGAAFADDITAQEKSITLTASSEISENLFSTEKISVEYTKDTLGIILCGALKNIYAIGAGLYGESGQEKPEKDTDISKLMPYLTTVASEMQELLQANHADTKTLRLSCGIADLVLSCSPESRNFSFGQALKNHQTAKKNATTEGLSVIKSLSEYPDFIIPDSATTLKDIIAQVQNYIANL